MADAIRDNNFVPNMLMESSTTPGLTLNVKGDEVTGRLLVDTATGAGTVTDVSVVTANGFAGTVATSTTTPAITLTTTVMGVLKGDGTTISTATPGTDYTALAFKTIAVSGQSDIVADSAADTLTLVGSGVTITTNAATDTITFTVAGGGSGTVTNVASADGSITVTNPTTTVDLAVVKSPKLTTARTIGGVSFDGTANITVATATGGFTVSGGNLALGTNSITMSGSIGVTGTRVTKLWATDLESTNMPTVGGTAILTSLTAPQFTTIELGAASDTTLSRVSAGVIAVEGVTIPTISSTSTITNKRNQPRIVSAASYTTDTGSSLDVSTTDIFVITAQAGALKFNNPGGTPVQGEKLIIRIKDNGTARALTYDTQFRASSDLALPTTTVISKTLYMGFIYNSTDTKWDLLAVLNNF